MENIRSCKHCGKRDGELMEVKDGFICKPCNRRTDEISCCTCCGEVGAYYRDLGGSRYCIDCKPSRGRYPYK